MEPYLPINSVDYVLYVLVYVEMFYVLRVCLIDRTS